MPSKKGKSLVDSFVFREAKDAVDRVTAINNQQGLQLREKQDSDTVISPKEQDDITKGADIYHVKSRYISCKEQVCITKKDHDHNSIMSPKKSIEFGSDFTSLSLCQSKVYLWFSERGDTGEFNKPEIQHSLSIPYVTVRKVIEKLVSLNILKLVYDGCQKKYQYKLNTKINIKLATKTIQKQDSIRTVSPSLNSSSSLYKETTTKEILNLLKNDSELGYWRDKKLKPQQVTIWLQKTQMSLDDMIESLKHCAFEMIDLNIEKTKPVKNVFNWFWKIIERSGYYPKPNGYKSIQEKAVEREKQRLEKIKKETELLKEIRKKAIQAEEDLEFEKMMSNTESETYKTCYDRLSAFHKRKPSASVFETGMRSAFKKLREQNDG